MNFVDGNRENSDKSGGKIELRVQPLQNDQKRKDLGNNKKGGKRLREK